MPLGRFVMLVAALVVLAVLTVASGGFTLATAFQPDPRFYLKASPLAGQHLDAATLATTASTLAARADAGLGLYGALGASTRVDSPDRIEIDVQSLNLSNLTQATSLFESRDGVRFIVVANGPTRLANGDPVAAYPVLAMGRDLNPRWIQAGTDNHGNSVVRSSLRGTAVGRVARYTAAHVSAGTTRYHMAIAVDRHVASDPYIKAAIGIGDGQIVVYSLSEATRLATEMRAGTSTRPLPIPVALTLTRIDISGVVFRPLASGFVQLAGLLASALLCTVFLVRGVITRGPPRRVSRVPRVPDGIPVWPVASAPAVRHLLGEGRRTWIPRREYARLRGRDGSGETY